MSIQLSPKDGIIASHLFLGNFLDEKLENDPHYQDTYDQVITVWSGMAPYDNPGRDQSDPAYWQDWGEIVASVVRFEGDPYDDPEFDEVRITPIQTFQFMIAFIRQYRNVYDFDTLDNFFEEMKLDKNNITTRNDMWNQWMIAVERAVAGKLTNKD